MVALSDDRPLILLDRDGTINVDAGYLSDVSRLELLPGTAAGLRRLAAAGYRLAIITNQSGVGRGFFTERTVAAVNARLIEMLIAEGVQIETVATCPHVPDDDCLCRKPKPGLAHQVARATGASLRDCVVIGDKASDIGLAREINARSVLIAPNSASEPIWSQTTIARDLTEAAAIILGWQDSARPFHCEANSGKGAGPILARKFRCD